VLIAGGLYREVCEVPPWNAVFGSGGRAAAAISTRSPGSILHTYASASDAAAIATLEALGLTICVAPSPASIAFAYFHPLSKPHIQPPPETVPTLPPLQVSGDTVLRFGMIEGEAIVNARRAVYDPQGDGPSKRFAGNGSRAEELALVLNELELRTLAGKQDLSEAAASIFEDEGAAAIIAKGGAQGATIFLPGQAPGHVPAYRSEKVFKIGTGDVFSAIFAQRWGEEGQPPQDAADFASRCVASYCSTRQLPLLEESIGDLVPVGYHHPGSVLLEGSVNTLGRRYVMEEARFRLRELGVLVISPALTSSPDEVTQALPVALLLIADGTEGLAVRRARAAIEEGQVVVILAEEEVDTLSELDAVITDDFVSALYFACWAAMSATAPSGTQAGVAISAKFR
jgi:hypothetical protein